jgi:hypothetical protein
MIRAIARGTSPRRSEQWEFVPEPAPCEACQYAVTCGERKLACGAFAQYIRTGHWDDKSASSLPNRRPYLRLFRH